MNTCNNCPFLQLEAETANLVNAVCSKNNRVLCYSILNTDNIPTPMSCPYVSPPEPKNKFLMTIYDVKPRVKWEDIQVGEVYHIPPCVIGDTRKDYTIESKSDTFLRVSYIPNILTSTKVYNYIYPNSKEHRLMLKKKNDK